MEVRSISQVAVAPYSVSAFNILPEFEESKERLENKRDVLDSFGEVLRAHHLQAFLGAALIHKHFPLYEDERIVEEVRSDGTSITPDCRISEEQLTPYMWHLTYDGETLLWTPVEFVISATVPPEISRCAQDLPTRVLFLRELGELLVMHDAQDTIGLSLLHRQKVHFDRTAGVLLEVPGPRERMLEVKPVSHSNIGNDWTQTFWHFGSDAKSSFCSLHCSPCGHQSFCSAHACRPCDHSPIPKD